MRSDAWNAFVMSIIDPLGDSAEFSCDTVRDLLYLYVCAELSPEEELSVEQHLKQCAPCRKALIEHRVLNKTLPAGFSKRRLYYYSTRN